MNTRRHSFFVIIFAFVFTFTSVNAATNEAEEMLNDVFSTLEETLDLVDLHEDLPSNSWFKKDKESNQENIDELLDEVIEDLNSSKIIELSSDYKSVIKEIGQCQSDISEYNKEIISADDGSDFHVRDKTGLNKLPFMTTKKGYEEKVENKEKDIQALKAELSNITIQIVVEFKAIGLNISTDQANQLLTTIDGKDFIRMTVVFDNVKTIVVQLEKLVSKTGEDLKTAKRYYGVYHVLLKLLSRIQKKFIYDIQSEYLPKLDIFLTDANQYIKDAKASISQQNETNKNTLKTNIESNETTKKAIRLYQKYLIQQKRHVEALNKNLVKDIDVSLNTYKTVSLSMNISDLIREGNSNFDALLKLAPPNLVQFGNKEIKNKIVNLTRKME